MSLDDLMLCNAIQAAFLTAALMPYSSEYSFENDCSSFIDTACHLFLDISTRLDELSQL